MIRIKTLEVKEFRGIRDLALNLDRKNFGICGANGTGKSGVVDAIEFCITGDVTRLSGAGTSGVSVKAHAPHVDQSKHPEKAKVTLQAFVPALNKEVTITRSVKTPKVAKITPDEPKIKAVLDELQTHPEFALSRREIIKYIITPPGRRSEDVRTLLRLEHLEQLRKSFTTFKNRRKSEYDTAKRTKASAESDLKAGLQIAKLDRALLLEKVNEQREVLGLAKIEKLEKDTSFKQGIVEEKDGEGNKEQGDGLKKQPPKKAIALGDLKAVNEAFGKDEPNDLSQATEDAIEALKKLKEDGKALDLAKKHSFISTGIDLIEGDACPLCDTQWEEAELREYLESKLLSAKEVGKLVRTLKKDIATVQQALSTRVQSLDRVSGYCDRLEPAVTHVGIDAHKKEISGVQKVLSDFVADHSLIDDAVDALQKKWWTASKVVTDDIAECKKGIDALPDPSKERHAIDFLATIQERYDRLLKASKDEKEIRVRSEIAQKTAAHYDATCIAVLESIYDEVAKDFSNYYRLINREDEESFVGKLKSAPAKLSFDVDFYGRGLFPPGAYHSEGHQDGMGLCLYLALMKHTLGDKFTFAVLDDVLMSVDKGHRREVCRLLNTEFKKTQFVLTTHDRVWLQYMKTENLIARSQVFGGWSVDMGPRVWDDQDIWDEIDEELDKENVGRAAWLLRHYLEYVSNILADNLRAKIEFRGDGHYDLGDLFPPVIRQWRKYLEDGEAAAEHWGQDDIKKELNAKRKKAKELVAKSETEKWAVNPSVHYNEWADLEGHEFAKVVAAFKELLEDLRCEKEVCKTFLYALPAKGKAEAMRCSCGNITINLKSS